MGVALARVFLDGAKAPARIHAGTIAPRPGKQAPGVWQVERIDPVTNAEPGADHLEQARVGDAGYGGAIGFQPAGRRCCHRKTADKPGQRVIHDLAQGIQGFGGGQDVAAVGLRVVAFCVGQLTEAHVLLFRAPGSQLLIVTIAQGQVLDQGHVDWLKWAQIGHGVGVRQIRDRHEVMPGTGAVGFVDQVGAKHHLAGGDHIAALAL